MTEIIEMSDSADEAAPGTLSSRARRILEKSEGGPFFRGDWSGVVFVHYKVKPEALQPYVPFPLDLKDGWAYVSTVAFTLEQMRFRFADGKLGRQALRFISPCRFLNARTYVKERGEPGIYFLAEWLSNRRALPLGPLTFGL